MLLQQKGSRLMQRSNTAISGLWGTSVPLFSCLGLQCPWFRSSFSTCYFYVFEQVTKLLWALISSPRNGITMRSICSGFWRNGGPVDGIGNAGSCGGPHYATSLHVQHHSLPTSTCSLTSPAVALLHSCFLRVSSYLSNHPLSDSSPSPKVWVSVKVLAWARLSYYLILSPLGIPAVLSPLYAGHHPLGCPNKDLKPSMPQMPWALSPLKYPPSQICFSPSVSLFC